MCDEMPLCLLLRTQKIMKKKEEQKMMAMIASESLSPCVPRQIIVHITNIIVSDRKVCYGRFRSTVVDGATIN